MREEKIKLAKLQNIKIYPIYKMFAWDLLFYYPIIFLFMSQIKGLSASQVFLGDACYLIFKLIFQPFVPIIVNLVGKRKGNIIGNIFVSITILYIIVSPASLINYIIAQMIMAIGYVFKGTCEATILDECIENQEKKNSTFAKIDGKGSAYWYTFEAISAVTTGFLFVINGYIPMCLCFVFCIIGTLISFKFEHYEVKIKRKKEAHIIKTLISKIDLAKQEYLFIFKSRRLRALLMFSGLFYGILYIRSTITSSILVDIEIPEKYFGIISGVFTIFAAISTWKQHSFHKRLHNKVLTFFSLTYSISMILIGLAVIININRVLNLIIIFSMMIIQNIIKGPYYTLIKRYLNSFSNEYISVKIYAINGLVEDLSGALLSLSLSALLNHTTTAYAVVFIGIISLILFINILDYMKTRIGLKPEEYREQDIKFVPKTKKLEESNKVEIEISTDKEGETVINIK